MQFKSPQAQIFIPSHIDETLALSRCTHLAIGAHPDDVELIGMHGIETCYVSDALFFGGVVVTDGAGSPRSGSYANVTNDEMVQIRIKEQETAARIGQYSAQIQLLYPSDVVKTEREHPIEDIKNILLATQPETLYLHNPFDRHASHRAVLTACIEALRELPESKRPKHCYGVEVWRSLDFLPEHLRIGLPTDQVPGLASQLICAFRSQVEGGKRYDLAFTGRGFANATFAESHHVDEAHSVSFALDLMSLMNDDHLTDNIFAESIIQELMNEIASQS